MLKENIFLKSISSVSDPQAQRERKTGNSSLQIFGNKTSLFRIAP